jgi:peptidoglycan/xylan/chitin deacetylase (PgdA/CDA1 family)
VPTAIALVIMLLGGFFSSSLVAFSQSSPNVSSSSGSQDDDNNNSSNNNKVVILVFDRAYKSQLTNGKPLLDNYGYKATIFAVCNWIDNKKSIMSWEETESLHKQGYDIQSHGMNHKDLRSLSLEEREFEVGQSKKCLHDHGINSTIYSAAFNR